MFLTTRTPEGIETMTRPNTRLGRWLIIPIPLLFTACCLKNPNIYFSTGTTVGLEATPPTNETPPHVTFGYKRAELALIPVTKLDKQDEPKKDPLQPKEPPPQTDGTPPSGSAPPQPETGGTLVPNSKTEQLSALSERGCTNAPRSMQAQSNSAPNKTKDAFSVLASLTLAVNWFGPAKIEQHFATGCAATHLIKGITAEEEDKRNADEASLELNQAKHLFELAERNTKRLVEGATGLEKKANSLKDAIEKNKNKKESDDPMTKANDTGELKKILKDFDETARTIESEAVRIRSETDALRLKGLDDPRDVDGIKPLDDAKAKAHTAIEKADKSSRNEELRQRAQKTKEEASQLIEKINGMESSISRKVNEALAVLKRVLSLVDECKAKIVIPSAT